MESGKIASIIALKKQNIGYKRIGKILKIPQTQVSKILIENGFISHVSMPDKNITQQIIKMYTEEQLGTKIIAKKLKMSVHRITGVLMIHHVPITPKAYHSTYQSKINHHYFDQIDTENKAYWLGFLYADGYNNEKNYQVELSLKHSDRYMLEMFQNDLKTCYRIFEKEVYCNDKLFLQNRITIYSKQISKKLTEHGCHQCKSLNLRFPNSSIVPEHLINHFMRGYFDGDGCISGTKFALVGTRDFLTVYVQKMRSYIDISMAEYWKPQGNAFSWEHSGKKDLVKIYDFLYKDATRYLNRKRDRFLIFKRKPPFVGNSKSDTP